LAKYLEENLGQKLKEIEIEAEDNISRPRVKQIIKGICEMDAFFNNIPSLLIPIFEPLKQLLQNLKRQKLVEKEFKRQSFDKFGDDFCELIISYLSLEDKIKFECVSKQWQTLIYNKQNTLIINNSNPLEPIKGSTILSKYLENVLKKAKFITKIVTDFDLSEIPNGEQVLELISKYCSHLKSIKFDFNGINDSTIEAFAENSSKKLTEIELIPNNTKCLDKLCALFPLLKTINNFSINSFDDSNEVAKNLKLKNLSLIFRPGDGLKLSTISNLYKNSVQKLSITCQQRLKDSDVVHMIKQLSEFKNCETLSIYLNKIEGNELETIINEFENLSNRATKIKRLRLRFERIDYKFSIDLLESMKHFKKLQKLEFDVFGVEDDIEENSVNVLSIESLQGMSLTHLSLSHPLINDRVFDEMSRFIPNLKVLSLYVNDITDEAFKSISKLKNLSKITVNSPNDTMNGITDSGVMAIIENCPKINSIRVGVKSNITRKTIDDLKALALRKPPYISIIS
jgi:hypothetical protein